MDKTNQQLPPVIGDVSRRGFLQGATALAAAGAVPTATAKPGRGRGRGKGPSRGTIIAYVGGQTNTNTGDGIYRFEVNPSTGELTPIDSMPSGDNNPTWLAFDPTQSFLYAANSVSPSGSVSAFSIDPATGALTLLNTMDAGGAGSTHCSVHPSGNWLFVANYGDGNASVLPINPDGSLGVLIQTVDIPVDPPPLGVQPAVDAPEGSFAISGHDKPHAHQIESDPSGADVFLTDLGTDRTLMFRFDDVSGMLTPNSPYAVAETDGAGPRHFAFHPNGHWFYVINEEASTISFKTYDAGTGLLTHQQTIPTLPSYFVGTNFPSEVIVSPDGEYVYGLNRLHDTIAIFRVGGSGELTRIREEWTRGSYPRHVAIEPTGNFMYVPNHRGDSISIFRIHGGGQHLDFVGMEPVRIPCFIGFLWIT